MIKNQKINNKIKLEIRKINELKEWDKNPRSITKEDFERLKKQIKELGIYKPLIINQDNIVLGGNMRLRALRELGVKEVWVSVVETKNEEEMIKYNLSDNDRAGKYEEDELINLLGSFSNIDLKDYAVDISPVTSVFDILKKISDVDEVDMPNNIKEPPKSKTGEIYQLGNHRLMCGDATKLDDVKKLMNGKKANIVFTDPPYNIGLDYSKSITSNKKYTNQKIFSDNKTEKEYEDFLDVIIKNILTVVEDNCHIFFWCDEKYIWLLQTLYKKNNIKNQRVCLWIKNGFLPTPQNAFNKIYEACVYGTIGTPKLNKNIKNLTEILNKNLYTMVDVQNFLLESLNVWFEKKDLTNSYEHTTQKPIELCLKPLKRCTNEGDLVLDVFGGSGSTLLACEQLNRVCYMMEIDPYYCDLIRIRYAKLKNLEEIWEKITPPIK